MHAILSLLLVSVSVGLSNFAGAIGIGLSGIDVKTRIRVGLAFGFFEAGMPALGLLLGHQVAWLFGGYGKYVGGAILILTGGYTIFQERFIKKDQAQRTQMTARGLLVTALALSIDNLAVGFALAVQIQLLANVRAEPDAPAQAASPPPPAEPPPLPVVVSVAEF